MSVPKTPPFPKPPSLLHLLHLLLLLSTTAATATAAAAAAAGTDSTASDKTTLLTFKSFLLLHNRINLGPYSSWNSSSPSPCLWFGISCNSQNRITSISLPDSSISGPIFPFFFRLPFLSSLDLSSNALTGPVPSDLNQCLSLQHLNLSHNLIAGNLNLSSLTLLQTLDLSVNRFVGTVSDTLPPACGSLTYLNISSNSFAGGIGEYFDGCRSSRLRVLDLSLNRFAGEIWQGFWWLKEFWASDNQFTGGMAMEMFPDECDLETVDVSGNRISGAFPRSVGNCAKMRQLNVWGNLFNGRIPLEIGLLTELTTLLLGNNGFDRELPVELLNCGKLVFLDLSRNRFRGDLQKVLGNFTSLQYLLLHSNSFNGGIEESGVLDLPNLLRLDLSFNNFSRKLPIAIAEMQQLEFLMLANNDFYGEIPPEYGRITTMQALDLSFNRLSGRIPAELGNLTSLLWLMLSSNKLTGSIPPEIGNCSSLLWLNLADNLLSGPIPPEISSIGNNPSPTFNKNRRKNTTILSSGECLAMKRWLPATYPPYSFVYKSMTRRSCRETWGRLLKGYGVFPVCLNTSKPIRTLDITGYLQLSINLLSGELPSEISQMARLSILDIHNNKLSGMLPSAIGQLPLVLLNTSGNRFSGPIPPELGEIHCLQILDLTRNNFSGEFPASLNDLSDLNVFNVSFNPLLHGIIPISGQIATFDNRSFIGDPLISFSISAAIPQTPPPKIAAAGRRSTARTVSLWVFISFTAAVFFFGVISFILCLTSKSPIDPVLVSEPESFTLEFFKRLSPSASISPSDQSSLPGGSGGVSVFRLDETAFTYSDIVVATGNFSADEEIGRGGSGVVYRGELPDGRRVAVKKLQREGFESERAFRAEMEMLAGGHPNLVSIFGWCLAGAEKLLVYEYLEGGSLEDVIKDSRGFNWAQRVGAVVGVARALAYLHHDCVPAVVHRDVKASNVMMDGRGNVKVTDFGLSRIVMNGETHVSTVVAGTVGYVAPEYGQTWRATTKGDVYSFGVLVMELATGRRAVEEGAEECLIDWLGRVGTESALAAMEMWGEEGSEPMRGLLLVGMRCMAEAAQARPDMREVLTMLLRIGKDSDSDWEGGLKPLLLAR